MIYFDIAAFFVYIFLIFNALYNKIRKGISGRILFLLLIIAFLTNIFDMLSLQNFDSNLIFIFNTIYFIFRPLSAAFFCFYIISLTDTWHKIYKKKHLIFTLILPFLICLIICITNIFTNNLFSITNGVYERGPLIFLEYTCGCIYFLISLIYIIKYKKLFSKEELVAGFLMYPLLGGPLVIQYFYNDYLVEMFATSIVTMILCFSLHRPEDLLDFTSGLGNRNAFTKNMERNFYTHKEFTLFLIKLSNLSTYRSLLNYEEFKKLVKFTADRVTEVVNEYDRKADLYSVNSENIFVSLSNKIDKNLVAEKILNKLKDEATINQTAINIITKICIAESPKDISSMQALTKLTENFTTLFGEDEDILDLGLVKDTIDFDLINEIDGLLDDALINHKFEIYYQPIYSINDKSFLSCEALLRLNSEKYGFIPPDLFIPLAEKSGVIRKIDEYVINEVCKFIASPEFKNLGIQYIEVNLSPMECVQSSLADSIINTIKKYNIKPSQMNLEITETAAAQTPTIMLNNVNKLFNEGIQLSIDDFGTGYSNIKRVASLPIKYVKIDKSFVNQMSNSRMKIILEDMIHMLQRLDLKIVVEGIETKEMLDYFTLRKCDFIQGYYFSKPIPKDKLIEFINKNK